MMPRGPGLTFASVDLLLGRTRVLADVSATVRPGSIHAIVGPNGGGKSSLLRCLLGQMPHRGEIHIDWPKGSGRIGYVPQALHFDAGLPMTVRDFLATLAGARPAFLRPRPHTLGRIEAQLDRVGLAGKADRRMGALSGGERQRVLLAQTLDPAPDLLILDEPMAALDEAGARMIEHVLQDLRSQGVTVLWVEHDLAAVRRLADYVTALSRSVVFDGEAHSVLTPDRVIDLLSYRNLAA